MDSFKAVKIKDDVYWVGAIDWDIRDFHGYATQGGTTYNAFLVIADKVTLIDTVKEPFFDEMMARISSVVDPPRIDAIISNHAELDHSGCLPELIHLLNPEKIIASNMGSKVLKEHRLTTREIQVVKDKEELDLGGKKFTFFETKMLHWPDSMFSYIPEDEILFSQDVFGMHWATAERFDDELEGSRLEEEAAKYYANILTPYSPLVIKLLNKMQESSITPKIIAPDHGPVWRENRNKILNLYTQWAQLKSSNKAVVVYDTMWQSTAKMAAAICDGLVDGGTKVKMMPMGKSHRSDVATELLDAGALIVGSPTLNKNLFPTIADILVYLKGLRRTGLIGAAFGSYGWGSEATKQIEDALSEMKVELVAESIKAKYVPGDEELQLCFNTGRKIADELKKRLAVYQT